MREREENGERGREQRRDAQISGDRRVSTDDGKPAPGETEPEVRVESAFEELEVVGEDEEDADRDEQGDPGLEGDRARNSDRARRADRDRGQGDEHGARNPGSERAPAQLVERVGADADREPESGHRCAEASPDDRGRQAASDDDVREMPRVYGRCRSVT